VLQKVARGGCTVQAHLLATSGCLPGESANNPFSNCSAKLTQTACKQVPAWPSCQYRKSDQTKRSAEINFATHQTRPETASSGEGLYGTTPSAITPRLRRLRTRSRSTHALNHRPAQMTQHPSQKLRSQRRDPSQTHAQPAAQKQPLRRS
jgi:hypothetical protein